MSLHRSLVFLSALAACVITSPAGAQLVSVPAKNAGDWVKQLQLQLDQDWEWVETYPDRVFFMTRLEARREGDIATTWMRVEYRDSQTPGNYRSIASQDHWDCVKKRRATELVIQYRWPNLQGTEPYTARNYLLTWDTVQPATIGEQLLDFACSIKPTQQVTPLITLPSKSGKGQATAPAKAPAPQPAAKKP
jgi:hypothetical protein